MKQTQKTLSSFLLLFCLLFSAASQAWADGNAPVAENLELRTYRNVSVGGRLSAFDPEDDVISGAGLFRIQGRGQRGQHLAGGDGHHPH